MHSRTRLLIGSKGIDRLNASRVIIFGLGGVGSWAAEALARSGAGNLTLVDADVVARSNINRQLPALHSTIGEPKVDIIAGRIADINPQCCVTPLCRRYTAAESESFCLGDYDIVIDAIDSPADKAALILNTTALPRSTALFSSMGAALRIEPWKVRVDEFWKVSGDPLAALLRQRFRKGEKPRRKFQCVYSLEPRRSNQISDSFTGSDDDTSLTYGKKGVNGAMVTVTATFGMNLAALAINHIISQ